MLESIFATVVGANISASLAAGGVLILRHFWKNVPKAYLYLLWIPVLFRLLCPYSFTKAEFVIPNSYVNNQVTVVDTGRAMEERDERIEDLIKLPARHIVMRNFIRRLKKM